MGLGRTLQNMVTRIKSSKHCVEEEYLWLYTILNQSNYTQVSMEIQTSGHMFSPRHQVALTIAIVQICLEDETATEKKSTGEEPFSCSRISLALIHLHQP